MARRERVAGGPRGSASNDGQAVLSEGTCTSGGNSPSLSSRARRCRCHTRSAWMARRVSTGSFISCKNAACVSAARLLPSGAAPAVHAMHNKIVAMHTALWRHRQSSIIARWDAGATPSNRAVHVPSAGTLKRLETPRAYTMCHHEDLLFIIYREIDK
jgi:hypothetical protein